MIIPTKQNPLPDLLWFLQSTNPTTETSKADIGTKPEKLKNIEAIDNAKPIIAQTLVCFDCSTTGFTASVLYFGSFAYSGVWTNTEFAFVLFKAQPHSGQ